VPLWASYVVALGRVVRRRGGEGQPPSAAAACMKEAVASMCDAFHATAWWHFVIKKQPQLPGVLEQRYQQAARLWRAAAAPERLSWAQLDAAAVLPQEVHGAARLHERDLLRMALDAALGTAAHTGDAAWLQQLLQRGSLLKVMPRGAGFDACFSMALHQGATPEAMEVGGANGVRGAACGLFPDKRSRWHTHAAVDHSSTPHATHRSCWAR
jgi:hypothetical protein